VWHGAESWISNISQSPCTLKPLVNVEIGQGWCGMERKAGYPTYPNPHIPSKPIANVENGKDWCGKAGFPT
ncbi:hypothetical protein AVEN_274031-1, partial [Araneus ventricosus]